MHWLPNFREHYYSHHHHYYYCYFVTGIAEIEIVIIILEVNVLTTLI